MSLLPQKAKRYSLCSLLLITALLCGCGSEGVEEKINDTSSSVSLITTSKNTPDDPPEKTETDSELLSSKSENKNTSGIAGSDTDTNAKRENGGSDTEIKPKQESKSQSEPKSEKITELSSTIPENSQASRIVSSSTPVVSQQQEIYTENSEPQQEEPPEEKPANDEEPVEPENPVAEPELQIEQPDLALAAEMRKNREKKLVVIDAGHQRYANTEREPVGPGAYETKIKVSGGTAGAASGKAEFELTLELSLKLQEYLEAKGYEVIQVRTSHDVHISNSERAAVANNSYADAFVRIHANGSADTSVNGAMTICQTPNNPYNGVLFEKSKALSEYVLDELTSATGCRKEYVWETDTMSGINWCQVPVTIVEVGYMSNREEDLKMSDPSYQEKICEGIANGIEKYLGDSISEW